MTLKDRVRKTTIVVGGQPLLESEALPDSWQHWEIDSSIAR